MNSKDDKANDQPLKQNSQPQQYPENHPEHPDRKRYLKMLELGMIPEDVLKKYGYQK